MYILEGKLMKKTTLFIKISMAISPFFIISCVKANQSSVHIVNSDLIPIRLEALFSISSQRYYSLIYSPTCLACKSTIEVLSKRKDFVDVEIYLIDYNEVINRTQKDNIGVDNYLDLGVKSVPLLLEIEDKIVKKEVYGFENIRNEKLY